MFEPELWVRNARPLITLLIVLCVLSQTLAAVLSFYRRPAGAGWFFENLLELLVLCQVLVCSLLPAQVLYGYEMIQLPPAGYAALRIAVYIALALSAATVGVLTRKLWPLLVVMASSLTLPIMETLAGKVIPYLFILEMLFLLVRSIRICILRDKELRTSLSALSIKNAIDSLHTGVVFSEPNGFILLANEQMQRLMVILSGKVSRNCNHFYDTLKSADVKAGCKKTELEKQMVYLLPDGSAWMFTRTELLVKRKTFVQLTAADITERWELTADLQQQDERLRQRSEELSETIANLHILSREKEQQMAKMRAHDILGERLALLLRTFSSERALDYDLLQSLSYGLIDELKTIKKEPSPCEQLDNMRQAFGSIGVEIELSGDLPKDIIKAKLFVDIAREAITNAVKHGFATKIHININESASTSSMRISNNGHPPSATIKEGGGLSGMRKKAEPFDGVVSVNAFPRFVVTIDLPVIQES